MNKKSWGSDLNISTGFQQLTISAEDEESSSLEVSTRERKNILRKYNVNGKKKLREKTLKKFKSNRKNVKKIINKRRKRKNVEKH